MKEYSLKFTQLSKHTPTLVANSRARINMFVIGVSNIVDKECRTAMLLNNMYIFKLMVYSYEV